MFGHFKTINEINVSEQAPIKAISGPNFILSAKMLAENFK